MSKHKEHSEILAVKNHGIKVSIFEMHFTAYSKCIF